MKYIEITQGCPSFSLGEEVEVNPRNTYKFFGIRLEKEEKKMKDIETMTSDEAKETVDELLSLVAQVARRFGLRGYALFLNGTTVSQAFSLGRKQAREFISDLSEAYEKEAESVDSITVRQAFALGLVGELDKHIEVLQGGDLEKVLAEEAPVGHA